MNRIEPAIIEGSVRLVVKNLDTRILQNVLAGPYDLKTRWPLYSKRLVNRLAPWRRMA